MNRLTAYSMLVHHALNELWTEVHGGPSFSGTCCPKCCAPCGALQFLLAEMILDTIVLEWQEGSDGSKIFDYDNAPVWYDKIHRRVDREFLVKAWSACPNGQHK